MAWPRASFDWSVRSCGRHGHVTYRPDEEPLAERLVAQTAVGEAWRCLRCGSFVPGPPASGGPAEEAPLLLRGPALRDAFILRAIATERFVRALLMFALAYGIWRFQDARTALHQVFKTYLPLLRPIGDRLGIDVATLGPIRLVEHALRIPGSTLRLAAAGVLAYGLLQVVEGVGLWLMRRWGEYVAVVATSVFIPFELYELVDRVTWVRVGALVLNLFAVVYIMWTKRLFGLRGGRAALEAERHSASLMEVELAALRAG